ncbi:hypothetical protein [Ferrovibrio xuzhouensis]|uniref:Secreted protein n=1 Tax=Ferrovibrio xuzhouensis TaxID=1576914 RepID=A0ABV7VF43_9PROT
MRRPFTLSPMLLLILPAALLLHSPVVMAQTTSTESLPPAAVQMPKRPVPPSVPGATPSGVAMPAIAAPELRRSGQPVAEPGRAKDEGSLLRSLLGQQVGGLTSAAQAKVPKLPGNDAFGAVQEILAILEADPKTDWNRVDLDALRRHLIDMNEVTLNAEAKVEAVGGGIRVAVTGQGRTLDAIRRMVPAHAREIDGHDGWHVATEDKPDGVILTVTAKDARQTAKIRGLGFIGVMATGAHHQIHHLAIARGEPMPHGPGSHGAGSHGAAHTGGANPKTP